MQFTIRSNPTSDTTFVRRQMQVNTAEVTYYNGGSMFLNWWKHSSEKKVNLTGGTQLNIQDAITAGYLDTDGKLINPVPINVVSISAVLFAASGTVSSAFTGEQFSAKWSGSGSASWSTSGGETVAGTNPSTVTLGSNPSIVTLTLTITNRSDPFHDVVVYQTRYASNVSAGEHFNPDWLEQVAGTFGVVRLMPACAITNSTMENYSQLATLQTEHWCNSIRPDTGPKGGLPTPLVIDLANRSGAAVWTNLPHTATTTFTTALATELAAGLNPGAQVWVEHSNEIWNFQFEQAHDANAMAAARFPVSGYYMNTREWAVRDALANGDVVTVNTTGSTTYYIHKHAEGFIALASNPANLAGSVLNPLTVLGDGIHVLSCAAKGLSNELTGRNNVWSGYQAAKHMKAFRDVFGTDSGAGRWAGVLAVQSVNTGVADEMLEGVNYFRANNLSPANSLAVNQLFSYLAATGYFGEAVSVEAGITAITKEIQAKITLDSPKSYEVGDRWRISIDVRAGMTQLNADNDVTITSVVDASNYRIDKDTRTFTTFNNAYNSYLVDPEIFDLIDASTAKGPTPAGDGTYPTKYDFFHEQAVQSMLFGECSSGLYTADHSQQELVTVRDGHKVIADANTLTLTEYEGGPHFTGVGNVAQGGTNNYLGSVFYEFLETMTHSEAMGLLQLKAAAGLAVAGGEYPSVYVDFGPASPFGYWGVLRHLWTSAAPAGDTANARWKAIQTVNAIKFSGLSAQIPPFVGGTQTVSGLLYNGQQLTSTGLRAYGDPEPTVSYQWQRANDSGGSGAVNISGATSASYTLTSGEGSKYVRRRVILDNGVGGSVIADSPWTGPINGTALTNVLTPTSTFDGTSTTGWSSGGELTVSGGEFVITGSGGGYPQAGITKTGVLTIGNWYRLTAEGRYDASSGATSAINPTVDLTAGGSPAAMQFLTDGMEVLFRDFQATGTNVSVRLFCNAGSVPSGQKAMFDNIKLFALP